MQEAAALHPAHLLPNVLPPMRTIFLGLHHQRGQTSAPLQPTLVGEATMLPYLCLHGLQLLQAMIDEHAQTIREATWSQCNGWCCKKCLEWRIHS